MKKIDFHIHTVQSNLDASFTFCQDKLNEYIETARLDCIAITNHNLFCGDQFASIVKEISIPAFPGIEIDLEKSQILLISDGKDLAGFSRQCDDIAREFNQGCESIDFEKLVEIFGDLSQYILIPHYDKKPAIKKQTLDKLRPHVTAGEVSSPKKFMYCINDPDRLVPVYFSDCRISKRLVSIPIRQTYLDCGTAQFHEIRSCLSDKNKVSLSECDGNSLFQALEDGQQLSTGLNVILGGRSSGKSHTLGRIKAQFKNVKYLKQFSLTARDEEEDDRKFNEQLSQRESLFSREYLAQLQGVVVDILDVDLEEDILTATRYVETLLKHANETEKHDSFSSAALYGEEQFPKSNQKGLTELIGSTKNLIRNEEFREVVERHVSLSSLKSLYVELMRTYVTNQESQSKKTWVNELVESIKSELKIRTAAPTIAEIDLYRIALNIKKVEKFRSIVKAARSCRVILRKPVQGFEIVAEVSPFKGAGMMKSLSKSQVGFSEAFQSYNDPYDFLQKLKNLDSRITADEYHKYFVKIDYRILNKDGFEASGGERSEFFLLQEIESAHTSDILLIDEPESSFDNLFLMKDVNEIIRQMSKKMPVVLVTHNNTVGASIKPDYLLCTKKELEDGDVKWRIYSGYPSSKELQSVDGARVKTHDVFMDNLEAGSDAYNERKVSYENLEN